MTIYNESFVNMYEHESPNKVKLGDDYQYPTKGSGKTSYNIYFGKSLKMKDVLYVPRLKKNLLSISALDAKGIRVEFIDGQVLMCPRGKTIEDATVIGEENRGLYKLKGHPEHKRTVAHKACTCALQSTTDCKQSSLKISRDTGKA